MKKQLLILILSLTGCGNFTQAQVGPDRFAITSRNNEYSRLLEMAYSDCRNSNHKDYVVLNTYTEAKGTTLIIQCVDTPQLRPKEEKNATTANQSVPAPTAATPPSQTPNETPSSWEKIYQDFKDSFK